MKSINIIHVCSFNLSFETHHHGACTHACSPGPQVFNAVMKDAIKEFGNVDGGDVAMADALGEGDTPSKKEKKKDKKKDKKDKKKKRKSSDGDAGDDTPSKKDKKKKKKSKD